MKMLSLIGSSIDPRLLDLFDIQLTASSSLSFKLVQLVFKLCESVYSVCVSLAWKGECSGRWCQKS